MDLIREPASALHVELGGGRHGGGERVRLRRQLGWGDRRCGLDGLCQLGRSVVGVDEPVDVLPERQPQRQIALDNIRHAVTVCDGARCVLCGVHHPTTSVKYSRAVTDARPGAERAVLIAVALGALLAPLNSTMIAVAVPDIVDDFDTTVGTVGWLVTSYLLALAVVQPVAGKLGDRHGRRAFVLGGLAIFGVASLGAALAPSLAFLIVFRVLQAVSGAVIFPNGAGLIRELVRPTVAAEHSGSSAARSRWRRASGRSRRRARARPEGGARSSTSTSRSSQPRSRSRGARCRGGPATSPTTAFDWLGADAARHRPVGSARLVIEGGHSPALLAPGIPLLLVLAVVFIWCELRHPDPVFQPRIFASAPFAAANAGISSSNLAFYTVLLAMPILLTRHLDWSSLQVGARARAALGADGRVLADRRPLADRYGRRLPSVAGCVVLTAGLVPLALAPGLQPYALLPCLSLMGVGVGLSTAGLQASAIEAVEPSQAGVAAGLFSTSRYIGSFAGSIALARLLDARPRTRRVPHGLR